MVKERKNVLCFGDSNTFGYDTVNDGRFPWGVRWPSVVQEMLGDQYYIIEEGMGRRTTVWYDPIENVQSGKDYLISCLESHWPLDIIIFMLGTNDLKTRFHLEAQDIAAGVENLAIMAKEHLRKRQKKQPEIVIISPIEVGKYIDENPYGIYLGNQQAVKISRHFPKYYKEMADKNGFYFIAASEYSVPCREDSVHMDADNHKKLALAVVDKIKEICLKF